MPATSPSLQQSPRPRMALVESDPLPSLQDFDAVFRRFAPYVASIGLRLLGSDSELDDLVQDVFLEAHRSIGSLRDPGALRGWIARITVRRAVRRLRWRRLKRWLSLEGSPEYSTLADPSASPEKRAEVASVYRALDRLDAEVRVTFTLRFVEGRELDEIADLCQCSKSTVQRRLRSAQRHLSLVPGTSPEVKGHD